MNFIKDFEDYINYFRDLSEASSYFKFFQAGGAERIVSERLLSDGRSRIESPLMFCEWPFIKINDYGTGNTLSRYTGAIVILENPDKDDWQKQDDAMNSTYKAVLQVINKMKVDNAGLDKRFLYFDLNLISIDPIENLMIDQWYGWRCEFTVLCPVDIATDPYCLDEAFWNKTEVMLT